MSAQMQISLLDEGGLDLHTGLTSAHTSNPSDGQWTKKKREFEKEQEASVTTQFEDNDVNAQVLQNKNCNGNKRVYDCPVCLKRFGAPSKLKRHCLIHTDQRPYQCSICCRAFRERSHLKAHFRTHTNPSSPDAVTSAEKEVFPGSKSSDRLCTLQLKKKSGYQCEICLKKFSFPSKLTRHLFVHFDDKAYTCTICRKSFKQAYYLHKHLKIHTGKINSNSGLCRVPQKHGAKSPTPEALGCMEDGGNVCLTQILDSLKNKMHEESKCQSKLSQNVPLTETNSSTVEIKSSEVQITTSRPIDLKHTRKGVNQCSICLKSFPYPSKLARHIVSHTDIRPFKCHMCLKSFQFRWHLQCHVRIHKKKGQNIIAGHLEQNRSVSFSNAAKSEEQDVQISLQDGAEDSATVHQDQNTVKENMINQKMIGDSDVYFQVSLLNEGGLDLPTVQSSGYFPKPPEGQWMEENQESAKEKEASITTQNEDKDVNVKVLQSMNCNGNKRIYDCPVCHKRFGAPFKLKRHCLIHTNQRPFKCSICCRAFRERSHLKVHMRTHTNPVKSQTPSLQSYKDNSVPCNQTSNSRLKPLSKKQTAQNDTCSTNKHFPSDRILQLKKKSGYQCEKCTCTICRKSFKQAYYLHKHLKVHTGKINSNSGLCRVPQKHGAKSPTPEALGCMEDGGNVCLPQINSSKHSEGQCIEENQESEEGQEASITTQSKDNDVNSEVWQSKNYNRSKRVYDCPVCHKQFGAPSKLKRHCLIHTNQRPFQCSICCRAFRERSHLKVHIRTHNIPVKSRTQPLQSYRDRSVPCNRTSNSQLKPSSKQTTAQDYTKSTDKQKSTAHQDQSMVTENMASRKISVDCNDSSVYFQDYLLNEGGWDIHTGLSSACSSKPPEGQWKEENQEIEEKQEASVTTQDEDNDANVKVLQSKNSNANKRVYDCPVCHKRFGAPSKLKRHCLIHTNQRPFQCSTCCRAFREQSHLKVHMRTHNIPEKRRTQSHQSFRDNKSRLKPSLKQPTVQDDTKSTVNQDENMVIEKMASQIVSDDCWKSDAYLQDSLLNKEGLDLHTGLNSGYSSKPPEGQWMEEIQESEEEQEASVTTQNEDNDVKVLQSKNSDGNKRVYDCPVCHKRFGAPSKLKRHCLIHTDQRPFQCSMCSHAFRERSHLNVHMRTHSIPGKRRTPSLQSFKNNRVSFKQASKLQPPKYITAHNDTMSTNNQKSTMKQDQNVLTEDMSASPFENVENKVVFSCNNKSVWGLMHKTDILLDGKKASDIVPFGRVSDCPPKTDSSLHHCASESRAEKKWAHHTDDIEDCVFVDSDSVVTRCAPDSYKPSSCQNQENPDVPRLPEVVVELEDFDEGECFIKSPHDLPFCPDCNNSFRTIRNLYAHNCSNRYQEEEMKKSHQCDMCFKFFNAPSKLKRHYITHTGQKPFQCTQCQKSFTQSHHLKTHIWSHR